MRWLKFIVRLALSLGMSGLFIWLSLRHTDVRAMGRAMAAVEPWRILCCLGIYGCIHLVRTIRWGILLEPFGHVSFKRLNAASAVGFMLLVLLPLRLGEFGRPFVVAQPPAGGGVRIRRTSAMASCVVERIVDGIFMGLLGVLSLRALGSVASGPNVAMVQRASWLVTAGFAGLLVFVVVAFLLRDRAVALLGALLRPLSPRLAQRVAGMLDAFIGGLHLGSGWKVAGFFALTALYWTLSGATVWLLAPGFGLELAPMMVATVLAVQVVGVMIPAGPGMIGLFQYFTQMGVSLFIVGALESPQSAAYANTIWALNFAYQVGLGLLFLAWGHVSLKGLFDLRASDDDEGGARVTAGAGAQP